MAITMKDTLLLFRKKKKNTVTTTQTQASWYNNIPQIAFISRRRCSALYVLGREGKSLIIMSPSFPSSSPGGQLLGKGTYTLNNATFLLQKGDSLELALTHASEKMNLIASSKGFSMASLASAEKTMPWQYGRPQKLRVATLCYSPA